LLLGVHFFSAAPSEPARLPLEDEDVSVMCRVLPFSTSKRRIISVLTRKKSKMRAQRCLSGYTRRRCPGHRSFSAVEAERIRPKPRSFGQACPASEGYTFPIVPMSGDGLRPPPTNILHGKEGRDDKKRCSCRPPTRGKGIIHETGAWQVGDIRDSPVMEETRNLVFSIR
jgi:hypothetical protein